MKKIYLSIILFLFVVTVGFGCSDLIVTKGASKDKSVMISYLADSHVLYGELYHFPVKTYKKGEKLKIYDWDTKKYLGEIDQVEKTYNVVGNMNEFQVAITESTFTGRKELINKKGKIDYGSLIYLTLQRSKTAKEAIAIMTNLVEKYGYYSSGESFSIADKNEVWIMEMIGKGGDETGAVWVAVKIPDGMISAHANCSRIQKFPLNDKENCLYSKDVISFARKMKYFEGSDKDFNFGEAYNPLTFSNTRFSDARVWAMFRKFNKEIGEKYKDYAFGDFKRERIPLYIKPDNKLSLKDVMEATRDHYQGTPMDMTLDLGAGPHKLPYRWRPLTWKVGDKEYFHERALSTQQTAFSVVCQSRDLPNSYGGIIWFGVDDTYSTCYTPVYSATTKIPETFAVGNGSLTTYSDNAAFWVFNSVSNRCYLRYDDMIKDVRIVQDSLENAHFFSVKKLDEILSKEKDDNKINILISDFSVKTANDMVYRWKKLDQYLLVKYMDGNIKKEKDGKFELTDDGNIVAPDNPQYREEWLRGIINETGNKFEIKK